MKTVIKHCPYCRGTDFKSCEALHERDDEEGDFCRVDYECENCGRTFTVSYRPAAVIMYDAGVALPRHEPLGLCTSGPSGKRYVVEAVKDRMSRVAETGVVWFFPRDVGFTHVVLYRKAAYNWVPRGFFFGEEDAQIYADAAEACGECLESNDDTHPTAEDA